MTTFPDLLYVAVFAGAGPLIDYFVFWPAYHRLSQADSAWARKWLWASAISNLWLVVALGAALWIASDRSWASFGFTAPEGWRLWTAIALVLLVAAYYVSAVTTLARRAEARARLRQQLGTLTGVVPHTRTELNWFGAVSLTAGFCEEFLFRGYFIWVFAPWLGWWRAAALSLLIFAVAHLYQGWNGVVRTGIFGALYTLTVAILDSLWPAVALHALVDLSGGVMAWLVLREESGVGSSPLQAEPGAAADSAA
jgi:membrane protease YdiL (CAAX protease family)